MIDDFSPPVSGVSPFNAVFELNNNCFYKSNHNLYLNTMLIVGGFVMSQFTSYRHRSYGRLLFKSRPIFEYSSSILLCTLPSASTMSWSPSSKMQSFFKLRQNGINLSIWDTCCVSRRSLFLQVCEIRSSQLTSIFIHWWESSCAAKKIVAVAPWLNDSVYVFQVKRRTMAMRLVVELVISTLEWRITQLNYDVLTRRQALQCLDLSFMSLT